jgi:nicotinamidase-related amidase
MNALVVVDMVNDFVTGKLRNPRSEAIIPNIQELLRWGREEGSAVIFVNDAHLPSDFELRVWGDHAMAGTEGAAIIPELDRGPDDYVLGKRTYSAFFETGLDPLLRQLDVKTLVVAGQHTNVCVRHTTADAFFRGYRVVVPRDAVEALNEEDHQSGLNYLEAIYQADLPHTKELLGG